MSFQKPQILWFLLCLAIPIIIHFIQFRKAKTVYFPGIFRLIRAEKAIHRNRQIRHWILLINRLLIFTAIILSFAQPSCNSLNSDKSKLKDLYLWMDLSPSMYTLDESGQTSLEIAKGRIFELLENASNQSNFHFYNHENKRFQQYTKDELKSYVLKINEVKEPMALNEILIKNSNFFNENTNKLLLAFTDRRGLIWDENANIETGNINWIDCNSVGNFNNRFISSAIITDSNTLNVLVDRVNYDYKEEIELNLELDQQFTGSKKLIFDEGQKQVSAEFELQKDFNVYSVKINSDEYPLDDVLFGHKPIPQKIEVFLSKKEGTLLKLFSVLNDKFELNDSLKQNEIRIIDNQPVSGFDSFETKGLKMIIPASKKVSLEKFGIGEWVSDTIKLNEKSFNANWFDAALNKSVNNQTQIPSVLQFWKLESTPVGFETIITTEDNYPVLMAKDQGNGYLLIWLVDWETGMKNLKRSSWFVPVFSQLMQLNNPASNISYGHWGTSNKLSHPLFLNRSLDLPITIKNHNKEWLANLELSSSGEFLPLGFTYEKSGFYKIFVTPTDSFSVGLNIGREESLNFDVLDIENKKLGNLLNGPLNYDAMIKIKENNFNFLYFSLLFILIEFLLLVSVNKTKM